MSVDIGVSGLSLVMAKLNKEIEGIKGATLGGLYASGMIVKKESMKKTPVDTGNLKGSCYIDTSSRIGAGQSSTFRPMVFVGYTAVYAFRVHENIEQAWKGRPRISGTKKGTYWDSGEPKFLEKAVLENRKEVIRQIKMRVAK